jgi:phosphatidylserine decarboxylase
MSEIPIWNRSLKRDEYEKVYGEKAVDFLYGNRFGQWASDTLLSRSALSQVYGGYQSSALSRRKIEPFIKKFGIAMKEFEAGPFASFNEFFARRFRPGMRPFATDPKQMPAFCEARYLGYEKPDPAAVFPVKGEFLSAHALLGGSDHARAFENGPLLIARLCPTDYHRFHFPDSGRIVSESRLHGKLHSVNPAALKFKGEIFATNERQVSILETRHFGKLAYIEVGAMCVGKIVQTHRPGDPFERGAEKGYFLFGASTVILIGEPGLWKPSADILENTRKSREVLIRLGEPVATAS